MFCNKLPLKYSHREHGKIKGVPHLNYWGETIRENGMENMSNKKRCKKNDHCI